jgi:AAA15 family ATPase/GTPase
MKIANLYASNVKRLQLAQLSLNGKSIIVAGRNEQGKSSLVDSILYAFVGKKSIPDKVINDKASKAEIYIDLTEQFRIERIITNDKVELVVRPIEEEQSSAKYGSPQDILDKLFGNLTFDPLGFDRMKLPEQVELLKKFLPNVERLNTIDNEIALKYSLRTDINKDLKKNDLAFKSMKEPAVNLPNEEISVAELSKQLTELNKGRTEKVNLINQRKVLEESIEQKKKQIITLELEITANEKALINYAEVISKHPVYDTEISAVTKNINSAEEINKDIRYRNEYSRAQNAAGDAKVKADQLTETIEDLRKQRVQLFSEATLPIEGLTFGEEGIFLSGNAYETLSESRRLLTSMKIGMALNPKLHVMFTKHGNDFDDERIKTLFEMAELNDYQLIVEKINPIAGIPYIVIEDGNVLENHIGNEVIPKKAIEEKPKVTKPKGNVDKKIPKEDLI